MTTMGDDKTEELDANGDVATDDVLRRAGWIYHNAHDPTKAEDAVKLARQIAEAGARVTVASTPEGAFTGVALAVYKHLRGHRDMYDRPVSAADLAKQVAQVEARAAEAGTKHAALEREFKARVAAARAAAEATARTATHTAALALAILAAHGHEPAWVERATTVLRDACAASWDPRGAAYDAVAVQERCDALAAEVHALRRAAARKRARAR